MSKKIDVHPGQLWVSYYGHEASPKIDAIHLITRCDDDPEHPHYDFYSFVFGEEAYGYQEPAIYLNNGAHPGYFESDDRELLADVPDDVNA